LEILEGQVYREGKVLGRERFGRERFGKERFGREK
jgi:hypothetical protein